MLDNGVSVQQLSMLLMMVAGYALRRWNLISKESELSIINLIIYIVLPCTILKSFFGEFNLDMFRNSLIILIISFLTQVLCFILGRYMYNWAEASEKNILKFGTLCSNSALVGNPVAESAYGSVGLYYASFYLIPQRIMLWSTGVSYFTKASNKKSLIKGVVMHPCNIAVIIGLIFMLSQITLSSFVHTAINSFASCCTPLSMLVIGASFVGTDIKTLVDRKILYFTAIRLFIIPCAVYAGCRIFNVEPVVTGVSVLLAAMPAGATTTIVAAKYGGNTAFASKCVVFTTAVSLVSTVFWSAIL